MAVEIRELVIKAVIVDDQSREGEGSAPDSATDKEQIIRECVNQVLKILEKRKIR